MRAASPNVVVVVCVCVFPNANAACAIKHAGAYANERPREIHHLRTTKPREFNAALNMCRRARICIFIFLSARLQLT
jgi:hypothetical protein